MEPLVWGPLPIREGERERLVPFLLCVPNGTLLGDVSERVLACAREVTTPHQTCSHVSQ